jgi:DNA-binding transcriptional regulator YhcF (GntR family)
VWALIQDGIESGRWGPGAFPTVQALAVEFRCAAMTASRALRLGEERGLVRKVVVLPPPPATKVVTRWRVVSRHDDPAPRPSAAHRLRSAIRTGEFTGALPTVAELARRLRVNNGTMSRACRELAGEGLLRRVWLPDFSRCVWYVIDGREPRWLPPGEGGKAVAIAADLARGLDRWCRRDESGRWVRRKLPPPYKLGRRYRTGWVEVNRALDLLVGRGLLERVVAPGGAVDHLPLPPRARPSAFGSGIPAVARRASTSWPTVRPRRRRVLV